MSGTQNFKLRPMSRDEVAVALDWAALEGWNPGLCDADAFYKTDPSGFMIAEADGEKVCTISAVAYDENFGFIGLFIVPEKYRHKGYGVKVGYEAIQRLGQRNIGLDGVVERQLEYTRAGFKFAHKNIRYEYAGSGVMSKCAVPVSQIPFELLCTFDRRFFPASRAIFLRAWLDMPNAIALAVMEDDQIRGYGVIRSCRRGFKIGPLFATNYQVAEELFSSLASHAKGSPVFIDIPEINPGAKELVARHHMKKVFETARMYSKGSPNMEIDGIYGITTFELG